MNSSLLNKTRFVCINLERRPERKQNMIEKLKDMNIPMEYWPAVDGTTLSASDPEVFKLFKNNVMNWRRGILGCALSHIKLWRELVQGNHEYYAIFEDDTEIHPFFMTYFPHILNAVKQNNINFLFLGHHYADYRKYNFQICMPVLKVFDRKTSGGSTGGYLVSKEGAISLLKWFDEHGMIQPIDYDLFTWNDANTNKIYVCDPHIIKNNDYVNSDIAFDYNPIQH